jgi:hypothetical protein
MVQKQRAAHTVNLSGHAWAYKKDDRENFISLARKKQILPKSYQRLSFF